MGAVVTALEHLKRVEKEAQERLALARRRLLFADAGCTHPTDHVEEYRWEHDNGYGHQTWITGLQCELCLKRKPWKTMGTWS